MVFITAASAPCAFSRSRGRRSHIGASLALLFLIFLCTSAARAGAEDRAWVQFNASGVAEARVTVSSETCPDIVIDGRRQAMDRRSAADENFALTLCSATLGDHTKRVVVGGKRLPVPKAAPRRIVVLGDTGCRLKGAAIQACDDPAKWPFPRIAKAAAAFKPDLVIHVGDYLYRESPCPADRRECAGSPWGDNWPTWQADFFAPAAPLLAAAPWVIVRGNHEDCARGGPGWLRLLGPLSFDPAQTCAPHLAPYEVALGKIRLIVMDDAGAPDTSVDAAATPIYAKEFATVAKAAAPPAWLLMHRPIWGVVTGPLGVGVGGNQTLIAALSGVGVPKSVELMLSGHIHTFEAINYSRDAPPQILAGNGGDTLDPTPRDLKGAIFQGASGVTVKDGLSLPGFGFLVMDYRASKWTIGVYGVDGRKQRTCVFTGTRIDCPRSP